jgi:hypothetical protein
MAAGSNQNDALRLKFLDQQPIGFDVALSKT